MKNHLILIVGLGAIALVIYYYIKQPAPAPAAPQISESDNSFTDTLSGIFSNTTLDVLTGGVL